jgi:hypothetical protein
MVEDDPEYAKTLTPEVVALSFAKTFNEMTIEEVETYEAQITRLRQEGRRVKQAKDQAFQGENEVRVRRMVEEGLRGKKQKMPESVRGPVKKEWGKKLRLFGLRGTRWLQILSGGIKGILFREFYEEPNRRTNKELTQTSKRHLSVLDKMKKMGMTPASVKKIVLRIKNEKGAEEKFTGEQIALIYWGLKNDKMALALEFGNRIDKGMQKKIIAFAEKNKKWIDFGKAIIDDFASRYPEYRKAVIELINEDPGVEEFYITMERLEWDGLPLKEQLLKQLGIRNNYFKAGVDKSATKKRLDISEAHQQRINENLYDIWIRNSQKQEHLIAFGDHINRMNAYLADKSLKDMIVQTYGRQAFKDLESYTSKLANPQAWRDFSGADKMPRFLKRNTATAYLAYNLVTMAKQLPSVLLYLPYSDPIHLMNSAVQFSVKGLAMYNFAVDNDPQFKERSFERVLDEARIAADTGLRNIRNKVGRTGMAGIFFFDKVAITIGWNASYNKGRSMGMTHEDAVAYAQWATLMTQPQAHVKDLAEIYTKSEWLNLFLQFTQQLNQIYNIVRYDIPQFWREGSQVQAILAFMGVTMSSMIIWSISNRKLPDEPEEWTDALSDSFIAMIPVIGRSILAFKSGYKSVTPPAMSVGAEALGVVLRRASEGDELRAKDIENIIEATAVTLGIPFTGPKRLYKAIANEDALELIGGPPRE